MPYQVKEIREAADLVFDPLFWPHLSTPEHPPSEVQTPPAHAPTSPASTSHVPATSYHPQAPNLHAPQVTHLVSGSITLAQPTHASLAHVISHSEPTLHVPFLSSTEQASHTYPKPHTQCEAKKTKSAQELSRLLDMFIRQLEDEVMSSDHGNPRLHSPPGVSRPSLLLSDYVPLTGGPADYGLAYLGPADYGPANLGPADYGPADLGPTDYGPANFGPDDFGPSTCHAQNHPSHQGKVIQFCF